MLHFGLNCRHVCLADHTQRVVRTGDEQATSDDEACANDDALRIKHTDDRRFDLGLRRHLPALLYTNALSGNRILLAAACWRR